MRYSRPTNDEALFARLPEHVREGFTEEQRTALGEAARQCACGRHPIDLRLSLPLFFARYYCALVAGRERRDGTRRIVERQRHPLGTFGNILFLAAVGALGTVLGAFVFTPIFVWYLSV